MNNQESVDFCNSLNLMNYPALFNPFNYTAHTINKKPGSLPWVPGCFYPLRSNNSDSMDWPPPVVAGVVIRMG